MMRPNSTTGISMVSKENSVASANRHRASSLVARASLGVVLTMLSLAALAGVAHAAPGLGVSVSHDPSTVNRGDEHMTYAVQVTNTGDAATSSTTTVIVTLPDGVKMLSGTGGGWSCFYSAQSCTHSNTPAVNASAGFPLLTLQVSIDSHTAPDSVVGTFKAFGAGAPGTAIGHDAMVFGPALEFGLTSFTATANDDLGADYTQAGGHPFSANTSFDFKLRRIVPSGAVEQAPVEDPRDAVVSLPPGFVGNPQSMPGGCFVIQVEQGICPDRYAIGRAWARLGNYGDQESVVYKLITEKGYPAEFGFYPVSGAGPVIVVRAKVRPGDYGITALAPVAPQHPTLLEVDYFTFCSYGAEAHPTSLVPRSSGCLQPDDAGSLAVPFLTNPTECAAEPPVTSIHVSSWQNPGAFRWDGLPDLDDADWKGYSDTAPAVTGCDQVPFDPAVSVEATSNTADSASGLEFDLDVPQDGLVTVGGIASSHLRKTVVELPEGVSVNPSAATGLQGCSDAQVMLGTNDEPQCPDGSRIGTVDVTSPLVDQDLAGVMYLANPKSTDPTSGEMLRLFLVVRNDDLGIMVKLPGNTVADPTTGRLTATFDNNPKLPFDHLDVHLKSGSHGVLATPQDCGEQTIGTTLTPWSGTGDVDRPSNMNVDTGCGERFAPALEAGNSNNQARNQGGTYSFKFSRQDGEQWLKGLTATLPKGLLASVRDVPLCSNTAADAGNCPADSKIGIVDAKAGAGDPFVLEQKGELFLTEGYKGGQYGLAVKVRPVAGPFRDDMELSPINVRQAIHVDRTTAQVTAISDPFPVIHHGIPLRVREVNVLVNRSGFMLNPSDCTAKQTGAALLSTENATANLSDPFQVSGCPALAFKPKLALTLTGRRQVTTGKHPGIKAQVTQAGTSEAGIEKAVVRLPKSLALDPNNAQALCEFEAGTKPDLENHCPKGSIVGRARAKTPLLNDDLAGNVYFVKNIRKDPTTGNLIRTLPMIIVALRGEISINLKGESNTTKAGKLVNTFANVPDAPIGQFNLNIKGGNTGIIAVTRTRRSTINLCTGRHTAEADMDAHNGRRHDRDIRMKTPCTKRQAARAKRAAKRASKQAARRR